MDPPVPVAEPPAILLVSAHPGTAGLLARLALAWGWTPLGPAASPAGALAALRAAAAPPGCAVVDDGTGGHEALGWALAAAGVPVVWVSGRDARRSAPVLLKPLNPDRLRLAVEAALGRPRRPRPPPPAHSPWHPPPHPRAPCPAPPPTQWHHSLRASGLR